MELLTTTEVRNNISQFIDKVKTTNRVFAIGRRDKREVIVIKYPDYLNEKLDPVTNFNANSSSFDFLKDEPDIYSINDLKKKYV